MDSMTNDKKWWCQFGCEVGIYYDHIEFSDGLKIPIPRNVKTDKIHNCPNLDPESEGDFFPHDLDVQLEMEKEQGGHFWDQEEVAHHFFEMEMNFEGVDGLEFKNYRDDLKKLLVEKLNEIPDFFDEIRIWSAEETLPACLQTEDKPIFGYSEQGKLGIFQPVGLLGKFYEMDGSLEDAKKCYEIQMEISENKKFWSNRIEEIDEQLRMKKQESLIKKQGEGESKKPQTSQQEQNQQSIQQSYLECHNFELKAFKKYAYSKIPKNVMTKILMHTSWYGQPKVDFCQKCKQDPKQKSWRENYCPKCETEGGGCKKSPKIEQCDECKKQTKKRDKRLYDKVKGYQAKEEDDTMIPPDPADWDYLDFGEKISILSTAHVSSILCQSLTMHWQMEETVTAMHLTEEQKKFAPKPYINRTIKRHLLTILRHRNSVLAHPKDYKKEELERRNKMISLVIQECIDFFEKAKDA